MQSHQDPARHLDVVEQRVAVAAEINARQRIATYLTGVGTAMRRQAPAFYDDMAGFGPTGASAWTWRR